jgi:hypothetical protein
MRHAEPMVRRSAHGIPVDLRARLEAARLDLLALFGALDRMDLSAAEIPQRLIHQLFELDADYVEALWALDQSPGDLDLRAMLRDTLAALEQLPDALIRFRKTLPQRTHSTLPGLGAVCPQDSRSSRGLQHGSGQRSPQRLSTPHRRQLR